MALEMTGRRRAQPVLALPKSKHLTAAEDGCSSQETLRSAVFSGMEPAKTGATMLKRKQRRAPAKHRISAAPFLCTINVRLTKPLEATKEPGAGVDFLVGYYRNVGVRAAGFAQLKALLNGFVHDGEIIWDDTVVHDFDGVNQNIADRFIDRDTSPIWYASGRVFYPGADGAN